MTVQQMFNALPILQRMMELKLPIAKAYNIYALAKQINEEREFFINRERQMISQFNAEVLENGNIKFQTAEDQAQFVEEHTCLMNCELESLKPILLSIEDLGSAEFTPMELMQLEGAIIWNE
jgi:hypothetical protein